MRLSTQHLSEGFCLKAAVLGNGAATTFKSLPIASFAKHAVQAMRMEALVCMVVRTGIDLN